MELSMENLGPINKAEMDLGDITVLIGPPNVGKSYTLKAFYAYNIMLDPTARNFLLKQVLQDVFEHEYTYEDWILFRILLNLIILCEDNFNFVKKIIRKINIILNCNIEIRLEDKYISANIKRQEDIDLNKFREIIRDRTKALWDIIPTTNKTKITINRLSPQLSLPTLLEALESPLSIENVASDKRLKLKVNYKMNINLVREKVIFKRELILNLERDSHLTLKRFKLQKQLDEIINKIEESSSLDEIYYILRRYNVTPIFSIKFRRIFEDNVINYLFKKIDKLLENTYKDILDMMSILYIPFGRSPLVYQLEYISREPLFRHELLEGYYEFDTLLQSYMFKLSTGRAKLSEGSYDENIIKVFEPILQGTLKFDKEINEIKYRRWGFENLYKKERFDSIPIKWASALAGEVTGILLPILATPNKSYILIEEPESQLHYSAQVLMALVLVGLSKRFKHKIIFSTHSDILALTLAYIQEFEPNKGKITKLIKDMLETQNIFVDNSKIDPLAGAISNGRNINIKFYYYKPTSEGVKISEKRSFEILRAVPGITDVIDTLTTWAMSL